MRICSSARRSRWKPTRELEAVGHVERPQQLEALLVVEVGAVAAGVRERAGLADRAQPRLDASVGAAQLEDLLDDRAILAGQRAGAAVLGHLVDMLVDLDVEVAVGARVGGADQRAVLGIDGDGVRPAGQPHALGDGGDDPHLGERGLVPRHERDLLVVTELHGERDAHTGEDDGIIEGDQAQRTHHVSTPYLLTIEKLV